MGEALADGTLHIDIGIATHRRPQMLRALLESLAAMPARPGRSLRLLVVDNDPAGSARAVAQAFADASPLPLVYEVEPRPGVSQARNRLLGLARGEYLAFVDDDEVVEPGWLDALVDAAQKHAADVVFGPVLSLLPPKAPAWIGKSGLFDRPRFATGTPRTTGGAGNVLLSLDFLHRAGRNFDEAYGRTGAEDTELFSHFSRLGARQIWCDEAVARETVTPDRATLGWLLRRNFASGRLYGRIILPTLSCWGRMKSAGLCLLGLPVLALLTLLALPAGIPVAARQLMRLARCLGRLSSLNHCFPTPKAGP